MLNCITWYLKKFIIKNIFTSCKYVTKFKAICSYKTVHNDSKYFKHWTTYLLKTPLRRFYSIIVWFIQKVILNKSKDKIFHYCVNHSESIFNCPQNCNNLLKCFHERWENVYHLTFTWHGITCSVPFINCNSKEKSTSYIIRKTFI